MTGVSIVGWAHSPFGKLDDPDTESLISRVVGPAILDAGVDPAEIGGVFVGQFNSGFSKQDFPSSLPIQSVPALCFTPAVRCENACASGSAAVFAGMDFIRSGRGRLALVIGVEKMTGATGPQIGDNLLVPLHSGFDRLRLGEPRDHWSDTKCDLLELFLLNTRPKHRSACQPSLPGLARLGANRSKPLCRGTRRELPARGG